MQYPVVLAIDFGTKRLGLAISRGSLAEPLKIIANNDQTLEQINSVLLAEAVSAIIVGLSENKMAELTREFVAQLHQMTSLPISLVDETLSSHSVHQKTLESGMSQHHRRQPIDHLAAADFLQEYLDSQKMVYSNGV